MTKTHTISSKLNSKIQSLVDHIDKAYKSIIFKDFFIGRSKWLLKKTVKKTSKIHTERLKQLKYKEKINVIFLLQNSSIWKYDELYRLFEKETRFNPIVVICPFNVNISSNKKEIQRLMKNTEKYAVENKYKYISAYDSNKKKWIDIKKELDPDIVFFSKPYKDTLRKYHIYELKDYITCYVPYGICGINLYKLNFNLSFHNLLWRFFLETEYHKQLSQEHSTCKGVNTEVCGSLGTEALLDQNHIIKDVWKPQNRQKKRIIWSPHHTIDDLFNFSNFLSYSDFMLELADKNKDEIQFAFKPHPILKSKLYNIWGKEKTENYYKIWQELDYTQLEEGHYTDLFLTSDALIHDCASFTIEYLYTNKPCLFMVKNNNINDYHNDFGKKAFDLHYHAHNKSDIENFISDLIIKDKDPLYEERLDFFNKYLYPKDNVMPSQKIINIIKKEIGI